MRQPQPATNATDEPLPSMPLASVRNLRDCIAAELKRAQARVELLAPMLEVFDAEIARLTNTRLAEAQCAKTVLEG